MANKQLTDISDVLGKTIKFYESFTDSFADGYKLEFTDGTHIILQAAAEGWNVDSVSIEVQNQRQMFSKFPPRKRKNKTVVKRRWRFHQETPNG